MTVRKYSLNYGKLDDLYDDRHDPRQCSFQAEDKPCNAGHSGALY